jgi:NADPH2:quinone reductase
MGAYDGYASTRRAADARPSAEREPAYTRAVSFRACRVFEEKDRVVPRLVTMEPGELSPGDVVLRARWSGINFKDALAVTGRGKILKRFPLNAGIDAAGIVESSEDERFRPGDEVLVNGMGLGESHDGGFAEVLRVPGDWIIPLPEGLSLRESMILGTAGFTAALALHRMETNGQRPDMGPVVVTGATGGVGSVAVSILASRGYAVTAVSGRPEHREYLRALGAAEVKTPDELRLGSRPLESARFGGAIDNVGGGLLAGLTRHVGLWGQIACVGMAASPDLETTVFPLILRGVSLLGISSGNCPMPLRHEVWTRLGADLKPPHLAAIASRQVPLDAVIEAASLLTERRALGRVLVECGSSSR